MDEYGLTQEEVAQRVGKSRPAVANALRLMALPDAVRALVEEFLDRHDSWVIDGSYPSLCQQRRLEEADRVLFLDYNRWTCLFHVLKRQVRYRGAVRPDMAEGCPERIDGEFLRWLLWEGRTARRRRQHRDALAPYGEKTVIVKNRRQLDRCLEELPC